MKNPKFVRMLSSSLLISLAILLLLGCNEKSEMINDPLNSSNRSEEFYLYSVEDAMNSIEDGTLENDMAFGNFFGYMNFPPKGGFGPGKEGHRGGPRGGDKGKGKGKGLHLGGIFYQLDLTEDQKETLKALMEENRECLAEPFEQFHAAAKEIMESKKDQMKAIRDQVKDGTLTREEAHEQIKAINESLREEIENCEACVEAKEAICACNTSLFESIGSELDLTVEQLEVWNQWLSDHPAPCSED